MFLQVIFWTFPNSSFEGGSSSSIRKAHSQSWEQTQLQVFCLLTPRTTQEACTCYNCFLCATNWMRTPGTTWASPRPKYSRTISLHTPQHIHCCGSPIFHLFSVRKRQIFPFKEKLYSESTKACMRALYPIWSRDALGHPGAGKHSHSRKKEFWIHL